MQPRTSFTEFETETFGGGDEGRRQLAFSPIIFFFEFGSTFAGCYFANYKRKKKTQAKQIEAIREVTPGTKRPEVNRDEALSKQMSAKPERY